MLGAFAPSDGKKKSHLPLFSKEAGCVSQFSYSKGFIIRRVVTTNEFMFQHNLFRTSVS